jgi:hypothetical protein
MLMLTLALTLRRARARFASRAELRWREVVL